MMNRFKVGDEVVIVAHTKDSKENYNIGDTDIVINVVGEDEEHQPYYLRGQGTQYGNWWIDAECLDFANTSLENE